MSAGQRDADALEISGWEENFQVYGVRKVGASYRGGF
jgi:hypothetical protein